MSLPQFATKSNNAGCCRRDAIRQAISATLPLLVWAQSCTPVMAKTPSVDPDTAFENLLKARGELIYAAKTFISKQDAEGLREYLNEEAININNYEINSGALLASKRLDAESKVAIGTIRRYGVGADVIIMYGSAKNEVDLNENPNFFEVSKSLARALDALDEVITICRSNGLGKKPKQ